MNKSQLNQSENQLKLIIFSRSSTHHLAHNLRNKFFQFNFLSTTQMTTEATPLDVSQFNETPIIKSLKAKQQPNVDAKPKSKRGRKPKYFTDEDRINARRAQQKAYRQRRNKELAELRALKLKLDNEK